MANNPHTQALLDEIRIPSVIDRATAEAAILSALPILGRLGQQATAELSAAQSAEIAEEDEGLRGRMELLIQTAGAQRRICTEIERLVRDLITTLRQKERYYSDILPLAVECGYSDGSVTEPEPEPEPEQLPPSEPEPIAVPELEPEPVGEPEPPVIP